MSNANANEFSNMSTSSFADYIDPDMDLRQDADQFPPPPPIGKYSMVADFHESDESKRFKEEAVTIDGKDKIILSTNLMLKIVGAQDENLDAREYLNRKRVKYVSNRIFNGRSEITDLLKSAGVLTARDRPPTLGQQRELLTSVILNQLVFTVRIDWEAQGKCEAIFDEKGKNLYVPLYNRETKVKDYDTFAKWPKEEVEDFETGTFKTVPAKEVFYHFVHPETGEEEDVILLPQMKIAAFLPKRD